jgi:hypothetical protein
LHLKRLAWGVEQLSSMWLSNNLKSEETQRFLEDSALQRLLSPKTPLPEVIKDYLSLKYSFIKKNTIQAWASNKLSPESTEKLNSKAKETMLKKWEELHTFSADIDSVSASIFFEYAKNKLLEKEFSNSLIKFIDHIKKRYVNDYKNKLLDDSLKKTVIPLFKKFLVEDDLYYDTALALSKTIKEVLILWSDKTLDEGASKALEKLVRECLTRDLVPDEWVLEIRQKTADQFIRLAKEKNLEPFFEICFKKGEVENIIEDNDAIERNHIAKQILEDCKSNSLVGDENTKKMIKEFLAGYLNEKITEINKAPQIARTGLLETNIFSSKTLPDSKKLPSCDAEIDNNSSLRKKRH